MRGIKPFCHKFVKQAVVMENKGKIFWEELKEAKKDSGFRVPEGYFDTLSSRISERITSGNNQEVKSGRLISFLRPNLALVAFFVGIAVIGYFAFSILNENRGQVAVNNESVAEYISYYYSGISDYEFFGFADEDINETIFVEQDDNTNDDIIEYLMLQEVDLNLIINEF